MLKRISGFLLLTIALVGCDLTTDPFQMQLQFFDEYSQTVDGCEVTFHALAIGNGWAEWDQVIHFRGETVLATYTGAQFWGTGRIEAGEEQASLTLDLPESDDAYAVQMDFRTGRTPRTLTFIPQCPAE